MPHKWSTAPMRHNWNTSRQTSSSSMKWSEARLWRTKHAAFIPLARNSCTIMCSGLRWSPSQKASAQGLTSKSTPREGPWKPSFFSLLSRMPQAPGIQKSTSTLTCRKSASRWTACPTCCTTARRAGESRLFCSPYRLQRLGAHPEDNQHHSFLLGERGGDRSLLHPLGQDHEGHLWWLHWWTLPGWVQRSDFKAEGVKVRSSCVLASLPLQGWVVILN